jgi:hypothetical protein
VRTLFGSLLSGTKHLLEGDSFFSARSDYLRALRVYSEGKDKTYQVWNYTERPFISASTAEFHIETVFLKMELGYLIFYVKPLY